MLTALQRGEEGERYMPTSQILLKSVNNEDPIVAYILENFDLIRTAKSLLREPILECSLMSQELKGICLDSKDDPYHEELIAWFESMEAEFGTCCTLGLHLFS